MLKTRLKTVFAVSLIIGLVVGFIGFLYYSIVGTRGNVEQIKVMARSEIPERGWEIMRYEGYEYGNFGKHGGNVWYHVRNTDDHSIQYRVSISLWDGELQYHYGAPERLNRFNIEHKNN